MPNVTLINDNPQEACITPSTAVKVSILTGPPGPVSSAPNTLAREWSYLGGQLTFPYTAGGVYSGAVTPQAFGMTYTDVNGTRWGCPPGATAWVIIPQQNPGQTP